LASNIENTPVTGPDANPADGSAEAEALSPTELRLRAVAAAARFYGVDLDINEYRGPAGEPYPSPASLVKWLNEQGLLARATILKWKSLFRFRETSPVVVLLRDGTAGLVVGADTQRDIVWVKSPTARDSEPAVAVDRLRLEQAWGGEVVLVRRAVAQTEGEAPFTLGWIARQVGGEKKLLWQISYASIVLSVLQIIPAFLVMSTIDRVLEYNSVSTFYLMALILLAVMFFEMLLGWARRELVVVIAAKLDAKLNLQIFSRMLGLSLEFFERSQAGETIGRLAMVNKVREFLTGKLLSTVLDGATLFIMVPVLFYMQSTLSMITFAVAGAIKNRSASSASEICAGFHPSSSS